MLKHYGHLRVLLSAVILSMLLSCTNSDQPHMAEAAKQSATEFTPTQANLKYLKVDEVRSDTAGTTIKLNGRVTFDEDRTAQIGSPVEGHIIKVLAKPGDQVRRGQTLLVIRSRGFTLAESEEKKARSALRIAEKNLDRAQRLFNEGAAPQREVLESEAALSQARAEYERAAADLVSLGGQQRKPLPEFQLTAPNNGVVVSRSPNVALGAEVQPGSGPLFIIADLSHVWVFADLPERLMAGVSKGLLVEVHAQAYPGQPFPGHVAYISELLDTATRTAKLRCLVPNEKLQLKPEMFVEVMLNRPGADLLIPTSAVVTKDDKFFVYVETDAKKPSYTPREVILGPEAGTTVSVVKGLNSGDRIVIEGAILLDSAFNQLL
ncbi:MAG TPA: efflux RND transporter periplasmic adaptor subunit [Nitrospirales bacterium]